MTEDQLQEGVAQLLRYQRLDSIWFHVPNGGSRNVVEAAKLKRMGTRAGVADLVFINGDRSACIELKKKNGRQTESQKEFQADCEAKGIPYFIIKSDDQNDMNAKVLGTLKGLGLVK